MFEICFRENGDIAVSGRLDAAQAGKAQEQFGAYFHDPFSGLELVNVNKHIADIFRYSGFDKLFIVRTA